MRETGELEQHKEDELTRQSLPSQLVARVAPALGAACLALLHGVNYYAHQLLF